jgi:hypothetical protein
MDELLTLKQIVPTEMWESEHQEGIRRTFERDLGIALVGWLREHGPAIVSRIEELSVLSRDFPGATEIRWRVSTIPIGPLVGKFYFHNGPVDGEFISTDGSAYWRIPMAGRPQSLHGPSDDGMLIAGYRRRRDIYQFEGYER